MKPTVHLRVDRQSVSHTREFDAPAERVFRAHIDPEVFVRWMGPRGSSCDMARFDAETGGAFRYSILIGDGTYTFFGAYHDVRPSDLIVHTWEFEGDPRPTLETLRFVDIGDDRSRVEVLSIYTSAEHCAEMLAFDKTEGGMDENFERLDEVLDAAR
jgi:uncharacterized protein YndB with AHSA1/START domain